MTYTFVFDKLTNRLLSVIDIRGNFVYKDKRDSHLHGLQPSGLKIKVIN